MQSEGSGTATYKIRLSLLIIWGIVRVPLVYACLCFETMFWLQGAENTESLSRQVAGEMQSFLHDRRNIMIDYYELKIHEKIGEGATAEVFRGRYKDRDVAVKVYTPNTITVEILNEFAEEIDLMRKLRHTSVAKIIGLSVMPPNIVVVLPLYGGGNLKDYLKKHECKKLSEDFKVRDIDEEEDYQDISKFESKDDETSCPSWKTRLGIAIEFCDSVRYVK